MKPMNNNIAKFELDDVTYETTLTRKFKQREVWHKPYAGDVVSALPGTIMEVLVNPGEEVKKGQVLLIQEAMKMQNRILSPLSGAVLEIDVKEGDKIAKNHLLLKIDPR